MPTMYFLFWSAFGQIRWQAQCEPCLAFGSVTKNLVLQEESRGPRTRCSTAGVPEGQPLRHGTPEGARVAAIFTGIIKPPQAGHLDASRNPWKLKQGMRSLLKLGNFTGSSCVPRFGQSGVDGTSTSHHVPWDGSHYNTAHASYQGYHDCGFYASR